MKSFGPDFSAIVIGASGGIGSALTAALAQCSTCRLVIGLSRGSSPQIDLEDEDSVKAAADHIRQKHHTVDVIIDATGVLSINGQGPEKALSAIDKETMAKSFAVNAIGPALVLKHFVDLLPKDRRGVFATLSARVGSIGDNKLGGWYSYRASKAALNQIVRCAAIEIARKRPEVVCLCLHPGTVPTRLSDPYARSNTHSAKEAAHRLLDVIDGTKPHQSGTLLAYDGSTIPW
ncbi:MAG: SDR family NAD(P)-dependent oxidoreductase [Rhizobiaceae bacterium]